MEATWQRRAQTQVSAVSLLLLLTGPLCPFLQIPVPSQAVIILPQPSSSLSSSPFCKSLPQLFVPSLSIAIPSTWPFFWIPKLLSCFAFEIFLLYLEWIPVVLGVMSRTVKVTAGWVWRRWPWDGDGDREVTQGQESGLSSIACSAGGSSVISQCSMRGRASRGERD